MSNLTPNYNLVKPLQAEGYNIDQFHNPNMDAIDTAMHALDVATDSRLDALEAGPSAVTNNIITVPMAANFQATSSRGFKKSGFAAIDLVIRRLNSIVAAGQIGNIAMGTLIAGWAPIVPVGLVTTAFGGGTEVTLGTDLSLTLTALEFDWPINGDVSFSGFYMLG